ncbi:MAG: M35 family metallo-endopeptidase, partial [Holophagales bacterium]|nr:M35 family metallo-endopeptidase [Holophagales bacterium]
WFGKYKSRRFSIVETNFTSIRDAARDQTVTFDCGCDEDYYAYVYPSFPYEIWLCNDFWTAPMNGTDSKAGTLVHELSHFYVVAGTDDVVYGTTACKALAQSTPTKAIRNADSYEYFAENAN